MEAFGQAFTVCKRAWLADWPLPHKRTYCLGEKSGTSYLCLFPVLFDELITSRFRAVADEQFPVSDHGMVPGLAREDLEARHFLVAVRRGGLFIEVECSDPFDPSAERARLCSVRGLSCG